MKKKILIIAAHPDDEVLGCGGYIINEIKKKNIISVLTLGEGVSSRFNMGEEESKKSLESRKIREKEYFNCLKYLGVKDYELHKNHCTKFDKYPLSKFVKIIENKIKKYKPNIILTHNPYDTNIDHTITFNAVNVACRPNAKSVLEEILTFEVPCSTHLSLNKDFKPNIYLDLNKIFNKKLKAIKFYKRELRIFPFPRSIEGIKVLSKFRGMQSGYKYAEAYHLERRILK